MYEGPALQGEGGAEEEPMQRASRPGGCGPARSRAGRRDVEGSPQAALQLHEGLGEAVRSP